MKKIEENLMKFKENINEKPRISFENALENIKKDYQKVLEEERKNPEFPKESINETKLHISKLFFLFFLFSFNFYF